MNILYILSIIIIILTIIYVYIILKNKNKNKYKKNIIKGKKNYKIFIDQTLLSYADFVVKIILDNFSYTIVDKIDKCDILLSHDNSGLIKKNKRNIVFSGEITYYKNKIDLSIGTILKQNSNTNVYYPFAYASLFEHRKSIDKKDYICKKTKFCVYMQRTDVSHRIRYFKLICKYKKVDALGDSCKNTKEKSSRHIYNNDETYNDIAVDTYKHYKFVIAMENTDVGGYFTEKILNPLIANSIPIYWGNNHIFNFINKKRIIYAPDYSDDDLLKHLKMLDENDDKYNEIISQDWYVNNNNPDKMLDKLKDDIKKSVNKEFY